MNKFIGMLFLIFIGPDLFASSNNFSSGFYLGFGGGVNHMTGHVRDLRVKTPSETFTKSEANPFSLNYPSFQVRGGYLLIIPDSIITFSLEGLYTYNRGEHSYSKREVLALDIFTLNSKLSSLYQIGSTLKLGVFFLDNYHLFLMGGIGSEAFKIVNELVIFSGAGLVPEFYGTKTQQKKLTSYSLGIGLEKQFNTHIRLGIEGFTTFYRHKLKINELGLVDSVPKSDLSLNRTFTRYSFLASVTYTFN